MWTIYALINLAHKSIMSIFGVTLAVSALGVFMNFQAKEKVSSSSFLLDTDAYISDIKIMHWLALLALSGVIIYDYGLIFNKTFFLSLGRVLADVFAIIYTYIITKWFLRLSKI